jgi:DNA invertase Pin-like site-specific DNA recombinase
MSSLSKLKLTAAGGRYVGYARELRGLPSLARQRRLLRLAGCHSDNLHWEIDGPGNKRDLAMIDTRRGDVLVVTRLICLANSLASFEHILLYLQRNNVGLRSLQEKIDTENPHGDRVIAALLWGVQLRRDQHRQATRAGLAAARARGRVGGRLPVSKETLAKARRLIAESSQPVSVIADYLGVSRATLYNAGLRRRDLKRKGRPHGAA